MSKDKAESKPKSPINERAEDIHQKALTDITVGKPTGGEAVASAGDKDIFHDYLPETLTPAVVKEVEQYKKDFFTGTSLAVGELGIQAMTKDKKLERVSIEIPMTGKDSVSHVLERRKEHVNHLGGGEVIEKFGVISTTYKVTAGEKAGQLKAARKIVGDLAMEKLKK